MHAAQDLVQGALLGANGVAVLNGPRFLDKCARPPPRRRRPPPGGSPRGAASPSRRRADGWVGGADGLGANSLGGDMLTGSPGVGSFKAQLVGFINACQYLRVPLIVANTLVILVKVSRRAPRGRGGRARD